MMREDDRTAMPKETALLYSGKYKENRERERERPCFKSILDSRRACRACSADVLDLGSKTREGLRRKSSKRPVRTVMFSGFAERLFCYLLVPPRDADP